MCTSLSTFGLFHHFLIDTPQQTLPFAWQWYKQDGAELETLVFKGQPKGMSAHEESSAPAVPGLSLASHPVPTKAMSSPSFSWGLELPSHQSYPKQGSRTFCLRASAASWFQLGFLSPQERPCSEIPCLQDWKAYHKAHQTRSWTFSKNLLSFIFTEPYNCP